MRQTVAHQVLRHTNHLPKTVSIPTGALIAIEAPFKYRPNAIYFTRIGQDLREIQGEQSPLYAPPAYACLIRTAEGARRERAK